MDVKKQGAAASASSFTADLFGTKDSSSTGTFSSIFPTPSKASGRNPSSSEVIGSCQKQPSGNPVWDMKQGIPAMSGEVESYNIPKKEKSPIFQEERVEPCHLSSSLYYGGQDHYSHSSDNRKSGSHPTFKNEGGEDDPNGNSSHGAPRGNWWQGSLYY